MVSILLGRRLRRRIVPGRTWIIFNPFMSVPAFFILHLTATMNFGTTSLENNDQDTAATESISSPVDRADYGVDDLFHEDIITIVFNWTVDLKKTSIENLFHPNDSEWINFWHFMYLVDTTDTLPFSCLSSYQKYWRAMILLRIRIDLRKKLYSIYPECSGLTSTCAEHRTGYIPLSINKLNCSTGEANYYCSSSDICTNQYLFENLSEPTICLGFFEARKPWIKSGIMLFVCMKVKATGISEFPKVTDFPNIPHTSIKIVGKPPEIGDTENIFIKPLLGIENIFRMYCSILEIENIPTGLQTAILGQDMVRPSYRDPELDKGCDSYLEDIRSKVTSLLLDSNQEVAIRKFLQNIGSTYERGSITILEGSAGTGKTNCVIATIGAILHHSERGIVGKREINKLGKRDGILRCGKGIYCIRILICSQDDSVLDSIMRKIRNGRIPNGKGGSIFPQMTRIAGKKWVQPDLAHFELNTQAEAFNKDDQVYARKAFANECVLFFSSLHECGSDRFKELLPKIDVIIIEEASNIWDPSVLIPIAVTTDYSMWQSCDVMLVGDDHEYIDSKVRNSDEETFSKHLLGSIFKRLKGPKENFHISLRRQYRIHPSICLILQYGIGGLCDDTTRIPEICHEVYNRKGSSGKGFHPFVLVNTESCIERSEQCNLEENFCNLLEAQIIDILLKRLFSLGSIYQLEGNIAIMSPYSMQIDTIQSFLTGLGRSLSRRKRRECLNVKFGTIAEMSGSEFDVVIVSLTRSNLEGAIGSITKQECSKAFTRARCLLIVIADISTFSKAKFDMFTNFSRRISMGGVDAEYIDGTELLPKQAQKLELEGHFRRRKFSPRRKSGDYNLRKRTRKPNI